MQERGPVTALSERRRRTLALAVAGAVAATVIALDQLTTSWALARLHGPVHLVGPLGLDLQYNSGTAFSLLPGAGAWIVPVVLAVCALIAWLAWRGGRTGLAVGYGLLLGGALGNVADRLFRARHGKVVDFVTLTHWPTFNLADAGITVGAVLLVVVLIFGRPHEEGGDARRARVAEPPGRTHVDGAE